jgi:hypothetical protein
MSLLACMQFFSSSSLPKGVSTTLLFCFALAGFFGQFGTIKRLRLSRNKKVKK